MNIQITTESLQGPNPEMLRGGALFALKRLQEAGHRLLFDLAGLEEAQRALLENEGIAPDPDADRAELRVAPEGKRLQLLRTDGVAMEAGTWTELCRGILFPERRADHERSTSETRVQVSLNLDGSGKSQIDTGLGFLDHMLEQIARHGLVDLELSCEGDLQVDEHHTIEDVAITLGEALDKALGDRIGVQRYAFVLPMDESRATAALDLSGRSWLEFQGDFQREKVGDFPTEMTKHFFHSLSMHMKATLHLEVEGENDHHQIEACFKAFARCLRAAVSRSERNLNILPSTKDLL